MIIKGNTKTATSSYCSKECSTKVHRYGPMTCWISVLEWVVLNIAVAIERLRITRSPRATSLLALLITQLEPEGELVLLIELAKKLRLVEADGERLDGHTVHPARGVARHHGIG